VSDQNVVALFNQLNAKHTRAAAGLLEDVCSELGCKLQYPPDDQRETNELCETLAECFRPMDKCWPRDCHAWDAAYATFGRWLLPDLPKYNAAVASITQWDQERIAECKKDYVNLIRMMRDEWTYAADQLDE